MKSASIQQVPQQWAQILRWIAAGEEVQVMQHDAVVARLVPVSPPGQAGPPSPAQPDFLARAKAIWGDLPSGKPLSAIIADARSDRGHES